jgi:hypothetical protein
MKTSELYIFRDIAGDSLLVPVGEATQKLNGMIHLDDTAAFIWNQIDKAKNLDEIVEKIQEEYEVDPETARQDVYGFCLELYRREMILDVPEFKNVEILTEPTK